MVDDSADNDESVIGLETDPISKNIQVTNETSRRTVHDLVEPVYRC